MSALSPRSGIQVSSVYPTYTHTLRVSTLSVRCVCVCVCVCVAKPVAVELQCHATALILVIGKAQFRRAMLSCDSSCSHDAAYFLFDKIFSKYNNLHLSRVMRKPTFCIRENKDEDQLRGHREADQRLCFRYIDSTIPLLSKSEISSL